MEKFVSAYGEKQRVGLDCSKDPGKTLQSAKDECDINRIIRRYRDTGAIQHLNELEGMYGDVTGVDYQSALFLVENAKSLFLELPAAVRSEFKNDPGVFLDFCDDPANQEKLVEMGIASEELAARLHKEREAEANQAVTTEEVST